ncbi:ATP-dependent protease [Methanoculleus sp. FWC-SCC1]|uniref:ATP-dependent protease n=1 Tax=Methanoculleus frigidifontis TaxID=2584085 RepID=A0ABT8MBD6_9EURY|nr:S16 family serine protease [Methanoculleus sp. FWC-SCC1]MDN7025252.1 ATP-dependent protease [Methanoculleus sp. FWC-SCC1]
MKYHALIILLAASVLVNVYFLGVAPVSSGTDLRELQNRILTLEQENADLLARVQQGSMTVQEVSPETDLSTLPAQAGAPAVTEPGSVIDGGATLQAPVIVQQIEYVRDYPFIRQQVTEGGSLVNISVEVVPGKGRVLVQTTPLMGVVFQDAANTAVSVAREQSDANLSGNDVIFSVVADSAVSEIDGPSAGALMTALLLAVLEDRPVNGSVTLTGTIDEQGRVGEVGGVVEKAKAAKANGKDLILLPHENSRYIQYRDVVRTIAGLRLTFKQPEQIDTKEYIEEEIGIRVEYVDGIDDVMLYIT